VEQFEQKTNIMKTLWI